MTPETLFDATWTKNHFPLERTDAFFDAFEAESNGTLKLASNEVFYNRNLEGEIKLGMTDDQVKVVLRKQVAESVESAYGVLRERIDKFGVVQPNIQKLGDNYDDLDYNKSLDFLLMTVNSLKN